jgi:hypothetical protein
LLNYPIFIVGSPRSGTSILVQALLGAGYTGHHEGNLLSIIQGLGRNIDQHFRIFGSENPLVLTSHIKAPMLKDALFLRLRDMIDAHHTGQTWFDKTGNPEMIEAIPILRMMWPDCRFIFAKRRGIENVTSRLTKFPGLSFEYHCADWARNMMSWRRVVSEMPDLPHIEIDQHDIAQAPEGAAAALAAFLAVPLSVQTSIMEIFERDRPQETEPGSAARTLTLASTGWSAQERQFFHKHCDAPMAAYGYTGDESYQTTAAGGMGLYRRGTAPPTAAAPAPADDPHDINTLLARLGDESISLDELLKFYIDYQGRIYGEQIEKFKEKVARLSAGSGIYLDIATATAPKAKLGLQILARGVEGLVNHNYYPAGTADFKQTGIFAAGANELYDPALLPEPFSWKLAMRERPAFSAFTRAGGKLFVGPHQYQYFDETDGVYFPDASSRQFSKSIASNPSRRVSGHVVLIQDNGAGENFTHFAYDWASRVMHALASGLADKADTLFVMGGARGDFQQAVMAALCEIHGLTEANFFFPTSREILEIAGMFSFFSDQRMQTMHPAQMAHPQSLTHLRTLAERIPGPKGNIERLFISRNDAHFRRISNEAELSEIATSRGYRTVELAKMPIEAQFSAFRNARRIVGAHGMGFSHLLVCEKQPAILELFHPKRGTDAYALLAKAYGMEYRHMVGRAEEGPRLAYRVDPDEFTRLLDELL